MQIGAKLMRTKVNLPSLANGGANSNKVYHKTSKVKTQVLHSGTFIHPFIKFLAKSKCLTKNSCLVNYCLSWLQYKRLKQNAFCGQSLLYTMIGPSLLLVNLSELNTNYRPDASLVLQQYLVNSVIA